MFQKFTFSSGGVRAGLGAALGSLIFILGGLAIAQNDKYSVSVPGGLSFSEFKGYESWEVVTTSQSDKLVSVVVANPVMIGAYRSGIPENGKPFPDGAKTAKIHWNPAKQEHFPDVIVPGTLHDVDFMVKDSKRFADSGGWGYALFEYDNASNKFTPGTLESNPPQANDAKCGVACHTLVEKKDYVFSAYGKR